MISFLGVKMLCRLFPYRLVVLSKMLLMLMLMLMLITACLPAPAVFCYLLSLFDELAMMMHMASQKAEFRNLVFTCLLLVLWYTSL